MMDLKYRRNPFKCDPVYEAMDALESQHDADSSEARAIEMSSDAVLFIFSPPAPFVDEEGNILASMREILIHMEKAHVYVAALAPWVEDVKKRATDEQLQFLQKIGLHGPQNEGEDRGSSIGEDACAAPEGDAEEDEELDPLLEDEKLEPAEALSIVEALVEQHDPRTVDHTCLELAVQTLRFIIDTDQVDDFSAFLERLDKLNAPAGETDPPVLH
jgi:hypothetical protein